MKRKAIARLTRPGKGNQPGRRGLKRVERKTGPDVDAKFNAIKVPKKRVVEIVFPDFFIKRMCHDPSKPVSAQKTAAQRQLKEHIGDRFGNTQEIVDELRGKTIKEVLEIAETESKAVKKLTSAQVLAKRNALEKEGTPGGKAAANRYAILSREYFTHTHRHLVCLTIVSSFFIDTVFPRWEPALKKRVLSKLPGRVEFMNATHYQALGEKIMRDARGEVTRLYKQLASQSPPQKLQTTIGMLSLTKAESAGKKLAAFADGPKMTKKDWPKIERAIILG